MCATTRIANSKWPELLPRPGDYHYKMAQVLECEFFLLEMLVRSSFSLSTTIALTPLHFSLIRSNLQIFVLVWQ